MIEAEIRIIKTEGKIQTHKAFTEIPLYQMFLRQLCRVVLPCNRVTLTSMKIFIDRPLTISFTTTIAMIGEIRDIMISLIHQTDGITVTIIKEGTISGNIPLTIIREITTRQMFRVISRQPPFLPKTKGEMFSRTLFLL